MYLLPWGILTLFCVVLDFITKNMVKSSMVLKESFPLIENVFHITYIKNKGASFGMLEGGRWFFVAVTILMIAFIIFYIVNNKVKDKLLLCSASFIIGGGIGNLIDRIFYGEVVDFFDFCLIDFAIFNVADCFVVSGAILMVLYILLSEIKKKKS